jgi:hypothetical protein
MPIVSACAPFHSEIRAAVEEGWSVSFIHRYIRDMGYPHTAEALRHYIKRQFGTQPKRWANQYGSGMRRVHDAEYYGI